MAKLSDSLKSPVVNVYNFADKIIASNVKPSDKGVMSPGVAVVEFNYRYDDEDDDICIIKLQASHAKWIELLDLQIEDFISVSWGYVGGPMTQKMTLVLRDFKSKYGPNVIYTELYCTDLATYLKLSSSPFIEKMKPIDYMRNYCSGTLTILIKSLGKVIYKQGIWKQTESTYTDVIRGDEYNLVKDGVINSDEIGVKNIEVTRTTDNANLPGTWFIGEDDPVREFLEKERNINTVNQSPFTVLQGIMLAAPYGPWYITGRNNAITIHNRYLGNTPYRAYKYMAEPGYLIDFSAETKYENFSKNSISYSGMNPLEKTVHYLDAYLDKLSGMRNLKDILEDSRISDEQKSEEVKEWIEIYKGGYQRFRTFRSKFILTPSGMFFPVSEFPNKTYQDPTVAVQDATRVSPNPMIPNNKGINYIDPLSMVARGYHYVTPITDFDEMKNQIDNSARKLEMEKEEAKMILEGDPGLLNDMVIAISGVQSQHIGNYYIKVCEHTLTSIGYKTELECFKVVPGTGVKTFEEEQAYEREEVITKDGEVKDNINGKLKSRYKKEEEVFRRWGIKPIINTKVIRGGSPTYTPGFTPAPQDDIHLDKTMDLDQFLDTYPDQPAEKLIEIYKNNGVKFSKVNTEDR